MKVFLKMSLLKLLMDRLRILGNLVKLRSLKLKIMSLNKISKKKSFITSERVLNLTKKNSKPNKLQALMMNTKSIRKRKLRKRLIKKRSQRVSHSKNRLIKLLRRRNVARKNIRRIQTMITQH